MSGNNTFGPERRAMVAAIAGTTKLLTQEMTKTFSPLFVLLFWQPSSVKN